MSNDHLSQPMSSTPRFRHFCLLRTESGNFYAQLEGFYINMVNNHPTKILEDSYHTKHCKSRSIR